MGTLKTAKDRTVILHRILLTVTLGISLAMIFMNVNYDSEYQLAMAYRLIDGDTMIREMWEPHQTSAFLCALFLKLFMVVTGGTTGVVVYMQLLGLLIRLGLAAGLYRAIRRVSEGNTAFYAAILFILISPKDVLFPEFGNMQLYFGTLLLLSLEEYRFSRNRIHLILGAVWLCLQIFSYPSAVLVYLPVAVILWRGKDKGFPVDLALFTAVCALIGGGFLVMVFRWVTPEELGKILNSALALEPSHTVAGDVKTLSLLKDALVMTGMLAADGAIGFLVAKAYLLVRKKKTQSEGAQVPALSQVWLTATWFVILVFVTVYVIRAEYRGAYAYPLLLLTGLGIAFRKSLKDEQKPLFWNAFLIAGFSLIATLVLSDNALLQGVTYMLTFLCVCLIPIRERLREEGEGATKLARNCLLTLVAVLLLRIICVHIPIYGRAQIMGIFDEYGLIRSGPGAGIITDEGGAARQRDSMAEWKERIRPGDKIWIIGSPVDTLGYLYEDTEVAAPSVMSTPTYNESLEYYYELNPDKWPDVIIVASAFGEIDWEIRANEWLMDWIENVYCPEEAVDGSYWRFYYRERRN